ncbi:MAG: hypothetical protein ABIW47_15075 [Ginsengibacter sp.]|jgi:hypothetical protein
MMLHKTSPFLKTQRSFVFLMVSIIVCAFWILGNTFNVYHFPIVGAIFEMIWLPVIAVTFILPVIAFIHWRKEKYNVRSLHLYTILIILLAVLWGIFIR